MSFSLRIFTPKKEQQKDEISNIDQLRYRKERWFDDDRAEQLAEAPINDDAAEGGPTEKKNGKKSKV